MWRLFGASLWASWYSDEMSYVNDIAVIEAATRKDAFAIVNPADCFAKVNALKELVKQSRTLRHRPHYGTVEIYPPTWQEFRSTHPTIFASAYPHFQLEDPATSDAGPLTPCPLDEMTLAAIRKQIPARASRGKSASANFSGQQMQICVHSMMAAMQQPRASGANLLPGFRMLRGAFNLLSNYSVVVVLSADVFVSYSETSITA